MIIALAFIESLVIYALLMFFMLNGKLPTRRPWSRSSRPTDHPGSRQVSHQASEFPPFGSPALRGTRSWAQV
jgi:hypothetical protein